MSVVCNLCSQLPRGGGGGGGGVNGRRRIPILKTVTVTGSERSRSWSGDRGAII